MQITRKRIITGLAAVAALGGGTAVAVAATDGPKAVEQAILSDAADELGVTADELRSALADAEDAQLDAAVKAGDLTQEQADEIREHRADEGTVLGIGGPHGGPPGMHHGPGGPGPMEDVAKALGITEEQLFERLEDGKSLSAIAEAEGRTLAEVSEAVEKAMTERLDADVEAGRLTDARRDEMLEHLDEMVEHIGDGPPPMHPGPEGMPHRMP